MSIASLAIAAVDTVVCFLRRTWRSVTCFACGLILFNVALAIFINGIYLPVLLRQLADLSALGGLLTGAAALVAALMPFVFARSYDKRHRTHEE